MTSPSLAMTSFIVVLFLLDVVVIEFFKLSLVLMI